MKLVYKGAEVPVEVGQKVALRNGKIVTVEYFRKPTSAASEGKVTVRYEDDVTAEYYVSVIGAEWVDREDRYAVQEGVCVFCGRDYRHDEVVDGPCPSDDCPSNVEGRY